MARIGGERHVRHVESVGCELRDVDDAAAADADHDVRRRAASFGFRERDVMERGARDLREGDFVARLLDDADGAIARDAPRAAARDDERATTDGERLEHVAELLDHAVPDAHVPREDHRLRLRERIHACGRDVRPRYLSPHGDGPSA
jgi:hypothetical protein